MAQLALNAVASIEIHGLVTNRDQTSENVILHRATLRKVEPRLVTILPGATRIRPPSSLPPPGTLHLVLSIQKQLGKGRIGVVFAVDAHFASVSLVAKVSTLCHSESLDREAWFYSEMESLQGSCIPNCYGLFQADIERDWIVKGWDKEEILDDQAGGHYDSRNSPPKSRHCISVLLLERLGDLLPRGPELSEPLESGEPLIEKARQDLYEIYTAMANLGIDHIDLRHVNILKCYSPDSSIAHTNETHIVRVIDFDNSQMTNQRVEGMIANYKLMVDIFLANLAANSVIEPWDFD